MPLDPFVAKIKTPLDSKPPRFRLPKLSPKAVKLLIAVASAIMIISMVSFAIFSYLSTNKEFSKDHGLTANDQEALQEEAKKSDAANPGGNVEQGKGGTSGTNPPVVTLTADPASVVTGGKSRLKWSVTNNPKECIASDDWSGARAASGEEDTPALTTIQTYLFTLTCKTDTGTGFATVGVGSMSRTVTGNAARAPIVTIAPADSWVYTGSSTQIIWSTTNSPTSCTASGDWSGTKSGDGSISTGSLTQTRNYTYTLKCSNAAGSSSATTTVEARTPPADIPIVTIAATPPGPIVPGASTTLSWSVSNAPTSCVASGDWSGAKAASGSQVMAGLSTIKTYLFTLTCSNAAGGTFDTAALQVIPNPPDVSITVSPSPIYTRATSTISWSSTNNPTSCTATGAWSGAKTASGSLNTGTMNSAGNYLYELQCSNQGGTSAKRSTTLVVSLPPKPVVNLSASPISVTIGGSSNLTWSTTNTPLSCNASGDWSGAKAASGSVSTGGLGTIRTYNYTLDCNNDGGTGSASTSVTVSNGTSSNPPAVSITASPTTIATGAASTLTWSATNAPTSCTSSGSWSGSQSANGSASTGAIGTAGTYTYTLTCTNSSGSGSGSATVTVVTPPAISISVSPSSITTGGSATVSWSVANSPTSCTAGGNWSGSKAASGSQSTGAVSPAGTYVYSLSCSNAGGTTSNSTNLTVSDPAPVYCGGLTPCYGPTDLAAHSTIGNCWGWNTTWVVNITSFRPTHKGGIKSGSTSTLENTSATCNHSINTILRGTASIPGYQDSGGATTHAHGSATINNSASSLLLGYRVGYYDATKP